MHKSSLNTILLLTISMDFMNLSISYAELIFSEEFNGTAGADISTLGWSQSGGSTVPVKISSEAIDAGNSAKQDGVSGGSLYVKNLPTDYTLGLDEIISLTWVAKTPRSTTNPSQSSSTVASIKCDNSEIWRIWIYGPDGHFYWYSDYAGTHDTRGSTPLPAGMADVVQMRMDISRTTSAFFYRNYGTTEWKLIADNDIGPVTLKSVDIIMREGVASLLPLMDSIRMESLPNPLGPNTPGGLSGHVELKDYSGSRTLTPIVIDLLQNGVSKHKFKVYLDASNDYSLEGIPSGVYDAAFSAVQFLRKVVPGVTVPAGGSTANCNVSLRNGDVDGSGAVSLMDANIILNNLDLAGDR